MQLITLETNQGKMENWVVLPLRVYLSCSYMNENYMGKLILFSLSFYYKQTFFYTITDSTRTLS